jgi:uncharacterized BrkB/YihY/UPF0761 family membrane protein
LAGIIVLLSWLWLSTVVLLTAAELNKVIRDASPVDKAIDLVGSAMSDRRMSHQQT